MVQRVLWSLCCVIAIPLTIDDFLFLLKQDNCICSLEGSLGKFKFLQVLDLSKNDLGGLSTLVEFLRRFNFLTDLNLQVTLETPKPEQRRVFRDLLIVWVYLQECRAFLG